MMKVDTKEITGERLRARRLLKGWTAREAALAASLAAPEPISTGRWQNWECAQRSPGTDLYPFLAKVLDTTPQYLAAWSDEPGIGVETNKYAVANVNQGGRDDPIAFNVEALKKRGLDELYLHLLTTADDAMAPDIKRGEMVLFDKTKTTIESGGIYALVMGEDVFIRFVRRDIGKGYSVYASNEKHAPLQSFSDSEFKQIDVIGRLAFKGTWLTEK
ncbi:XRE family transcriptional regulator [Enterovibrio norvegicus]|uniref:XRE family transcriptional regulator n=1 Tax=Enterovibrio norvegicus TaxID=188144 RepID=UPI000C849A9F|nr:LexA family transcriptional regulator [Enterovibrio norvegicus]PMN73179.1 hypothetical protein BCT27_12615 [Enterovibrio norvegicus]